MVNFVSEFPINVVDESTTMYDITKCYVIPVQFLYLHYVMDNLKLELKPEEMRSNDRVTTRFMGELFSDFLWAKKNNTIPDVQFAVYDSDLRKWYSITNVRTPYITFLIGTEEKKIGSLGSFYSFDGKQVESIVRASTEYAHNELTMDLCGKAIPVSLKSLAPIHGESAALFD
jgi:hypothetical protein